MGKKNQKKNKQQKGVQENQQQQEEVSVQNSKKEEAKTKAKKDQQTQPEQQQEQQQQQVEEPQLNGEERALKYKESQLEIFNGYQKQFEEDEIFVSNEPLFADKQRDFEKREKEEFKKLEKGFKREIQDVEDIFNDSSLKGEQKFKQLKERITKTIRENTKQEVQVQKVMTQCQERDSQLDELRKEVNKLSEMRSRLKTMCFSLLEKNYQQYLTHQLFIDDEQRERIKLQEIFQVRMKEVTADLEVQKDQRTKEYEENQQWRQKITELIAKYKEKEAIYQKEMNEYKVQFEVQNKKSRAQIEERLGPLAKEAETKKEQLGKGIEKVKDLTERIQHYMTKFDTIKDDMTKNSKKFEDYQSEVEMKKAKIQTLETDIQTLQLMQGKEQKIIIEIEIEKKKLQDQAKTFTSLKESLEKQYNLLNDSANKENESANQ